MFACLQVQEQDAKVKFLTKTFWIHIYIARIQGIDLEACFCWALCVIHHERQALLQSDSGPVWAEQPQRLSVFFH